MKNLATLLQYGDIVLYGYIERDLPSVLNNKKQGRVSVFVKRDGRRKDISYATSIRTYRNVLDIGWEPGDVCFLDNEATKGMVIGFPSASPYVLVCLRLRYLPWIVIGMIRRVIIGQVKVEGIRKFESSGKKNQWLVLRRSQSLPKGPMFLSREVGVQGLLDHLRERHVSYVVLRFFQKLPNLFREGGDLDLLVADEDEGRIRAFIAEHPGTLRIDIWSVSAPTYNGISCYLPPLARKILASAIDGPAGSKVPSPKEAFLSFIYHALYHKGVRAGIPSITPGVEVHKDAENDYASMIAHMAKELDIEVGDTMEELDEYLFQEGWRPKLDTLVKIAEWNEWVRLRFFRERSSHDIRFCVFILKELALENGIEQSMLQAMEDEGFRIVRKKKLEGEDRVRAAEQLRGGTWTEGKDGTEGRIFQPALAVILWDMYGKGYERVRILKEKIRNKFDKGKISLVHSTDNLSEAQDYIALCFPKEQKAIEKELHTLQKTSRLPISHRVQSFVKLLPYHQRRIFSRAKSLLISLLIR